MAAVVPGCLLQGKCDLRLARCLVRQSSWDLGCFRAWGFHGKQFPSLWFSGFDFRVFDVSFQDKDFFESLSWKHTPNPKAGCKSCGRVNLKSDLFT